MLLIGIGLSTTLPYVSLYCTQDLGMSVSTFGVFMAVSRLSGVVVNSLIAKRSDGGLDRKWLIIYSMCSSALGYMSYLLFHNLFVLVLAVALFNGLGAPAMPQMYAYARESAAARKFDDMTFAMSTLRSLLSLGFVAGPLAGTIILRFLGYKGLFLGTSIIYAIIASLMFFFLPQRKVQENMNRGSHTRASSLANRQIRLPLMAFTLLFAVNAVNMMNTPLFIVNDIHGTHMDVGLVTSVSAGLEIPIMIVLGSLARRISNHTLMIYGCFVAVLYYTILAVSNHPWELIVAQLFQAAFVAIVMGNGLSYFTDLLPDSPGFATTIYSNGSTIGLLVGSLGAGAMAQYAGFRSVYWACLAMVVLAFVVLWKSRPVVDLEASMEPTQSG